MSNQRYCTVFIVFNFYSLRLLFHAHVRVKNKIQFYEQEKEAPCTYGEQSLLHAELDSVKMNYLEPVVNSLISDEEESGSDDDVPDFSDIEAMVNLRCL